MSTIASAAPDLKRWTKLFIFISIAAMAGYAAAVALVPKKDRKGFSYGMVVTGLIMSIISIIYNGILLGKEWGWAQGLRAMGNSAAAASMAKVAGPITNVGTGAVAAA